MARWKIILSLVAIFIAGAISGAVVTLRVVKKVAGNNGPDRWPAGMMMVYQKKLKLTPEQMEKLQPFVEDARKEWMQAMRSTIASQMGLVRKLDEQMVPMLTPEQLKLHEEMKREFRERARQRPGFKPPFEKGPLDRPPFERPPLEKK